MMDPFLFLEQREKNTKIFKSNDNLCFPALVPTPLSLIKSIKYLDDLTEYTRTEYYWSVCP